MPQHHIARLLVHSDRDLHLAAGSRIVGSGERVRFLFVVREGSARMLRRQRGGAVLVLQRARSGQLVAEVGGLCGAPRR